MRRRAKSEKQKAALFSLQIHDLQRLRETDLRLEAGLPHCFQNVRCRLDERHLLRISFEVVQSPELQRIKVRQVEQQTLVKIRVGSRRDRVRLLLEIRRQQQNALVGML